MGGSPHLTASGWLRRMMRVSSRRSASEGSSIPSSKPRKSTSEMPSTRQARRCSSSRIGTSASRVMSAGVCSFEPVPPLVMHTVTISLPARAHFASVPPTVNSWSSGWAWMLITRLGGGGSRRAGFASFARSGTPGAAVSPSGSWAVTVSGSGTSGALVSGLHVHRGKAGQLCLDLSLRHRADHLIRDRAVLDEENGRDGADPVPSREGRLLVHIDLRQGHASLRGQRQFFEHRGDGSAGTAPCGPKIHHPHALGGGERFVEGLLGEMHDAGLGTFLLRAHGSSSTVETPLVAKRMRTGLDRGTGGWRPS